MGQIIRDVYNLPSLWIKYAVKDRIEGIQSQVFLGPTRMGEPVWISIWDLMGIESEAFPNFSLYQILQNADDSEILVAMAQSRISSQIHMVAEYSDFNEPQVFWFHIDRAANEISTLPWEFLISRLLDKAIPIRIPNFVASSYQYKKNPTIAICASAPVGDGPWMISNEISHLIQRLEVICYDCPDAKVHLFLDQALIEQAEFVDGLNIRQEFLADITFHRFDPMEATKVNSYRKNSLRQSIWLSWMEEKLHSIGADIVHFFAPSVLEPQAGQIVLATTPSKNQIVGEAIGAGELYQFLERVRCQALILSNPYFRTWQIGQRMLATEMSWLRPCPVFALEGGPAALDGVYSLLLQPTMHHQFGLEPLHFRLAQHNEVAHMCVHPALLVDNNQDFETASQSINAFSTLESEEANSGDWQKRFGASNFKRGFSKPTDYRNLDTERYRAKEAFEYLGRLEAKLAPLSAPNPTAMASFQGSLNAASFLQKLALDAQAGAFDSVSLKGNFGEEPQQGGNGTSELGADSGLNQQIGRYQNLEGE
jgi:hypothetical protein